jgi:hypothetical protein
MKKHELTAEKFLCSSCGDVFTAAATRNNHERAQHSKNPFYCPSALCTARYKYKKDLDRHISLNHPQTLPSDTKQQLPSSRCAFTNESE